jgi:hypothetical protein
MGDLSDLVSTAETVEDQKQRGWSRKEASNPVAQEPTPSTWEAVVKANPALSKFEDAASLAKSFEALSSAMGLSVEDAIAVASGAKQVDPKGQSPPDTSGRSEENSASNPETERLLSEFIATAPAKAQEQLQQREQHLRQQAREKQAREKAREEIRKDILGTMGESGATGGTGYVGEAKDDGGRKVVQEILDAETRTNPTIKLTPA